MRSNQFVALGLLITTFVLLLISLKPHETMYVYLDKVKEQMQGDSNEPHRLMYDSWKRCMVNLTDGIRDDHEKTWAQIGKIVQQCEQPFAKMLNIQDFSNSDETKRHILPLKKTDSQVVVTLGVGHDTAAEELLLKTIGKKKVNFYGADPMTEINEALYSKFGKYFAFAVSNKPGFSIANILLPNSSTAYVDKLVVNVDAVYFLTKMIGKTFFDTIWMDAEGAEYGLFDFINKGGDFDKNDIVICQMNLEIHSPGEKRKKLLRSFIYQTLDDERYAFFLPVQSVHLRLFFVNFADPQCVDKYIPSNFDASTLPF